MNKLFVPYPIAVALKEIGFDELCLGLFTEDGLQYDGEEYSLPFHNSIANEPGIDTRLVAAPIYEQVIDWFIEKYNLFLMWDRQPKKKNIFEFFYFIKQGNGWDTEPLFSGTFNSRPKALNAGIEKCIQLIKQQK